DEPPLFLFVVLRLCLDICRGRHTFEAFSFTWNAAMAKPGRTSSASLPVLPVDGQPAKLVPPENLSEAERAIFEEIVDSVARSHFRVCDRVLLAAYCRAVALELRAGAALERDPLDKAALALWEKSSRAMATLAARLRLCPSARQHPRSTAREATYSGPRPWAT